MKKLVEYLEEFDYDLDVCDNIDAYHISNFLDDTFCIHDLSDYKISLHEVYKNFLEWRELYPIVPIVKSADFFCYVGEYVDCCAAVDSDDVRMDKAFLYGFKYKNKPDDSMDKLALLMQLGFAYKQKTTKSTN